MLDDTSQDSLEVEELTTYARVPTWIARSGEGLSDGAVRLYTTIMSYADNTALTAFPGREKLANDMGKSVASIKRHIKELEVFGALKVTRRRNRQTGNFLSNHYKLVFNNPGVTHAPPQRITSDPVTRLTSKLDSASFTSDAFASDNPKETFTSTQSAPTTNPGNLSQEQRKQLRDQLAHIGQLTQAGHKFHDDEIQDQWENFKTLMEAAFPDDYDNTSMADNLENGKWTLSAKVADPYEAGVELNKIINTALACR